jgi:hypothetical protein
VVQEDLVVQEEILIQVEDQVDQVEQELVMMEASNHHFSFIVIIAAAVEAVAVQVLLEMQEHPETQELQEIQEPQDHLLQEVLDQQQMQVILQES